MGFTAFIHHLFFLKHVVMVTKKVKLKITRIKDVKGLLELSIGTWALSVSTDNIFRLSKRHTRILQTIRFHQQLLHFTQFNR